MYEVVRQRGWWNSTVHLHLSPSPPSSLFRFDI